MSLVFPFVQHTLPEHPCPSHCQYFARNNAAHRHTHAHWMDRPLGRLQLHHPSPACASLVPRSSLGPQNPDSHRTSIPCIGISATFLAIWGLALSDSGLAAVTLAAWGVMNAEPKRSGCRAGVMPRDDSVYRRRLTTRVLGRGKVKLPSQLRRLRLRPGICSLAMINTYILAWMDDVLCIVYAITCSHIPYSSQHYHIIKVIHTVLYYTMHNMSTQRSATCLS